MYMRVVFSIVKINGIKPRLCNPLIFIAKRRHSIGSSKTIFYDFVRHAKEITRLVVFGGDTRKVFGFKPHRKNIFLFFK